MIKRKRKISHRLFFKTGKKRHEKTANFFSRHDFVVLVFWLLFFIIIARLLHFQITNNLNNSNINKYAANVTHKQSTEKQKRGSILDRNGNTLAMSVKKYNLYIDAKMIKNLPETEVLLKKYDIALTPHHKKFIEKRKSYIPVKSNIDAKTAKRIQEQNIDGIGFESSYVRLYPEEELAAHIVGKTGKGEKGTYGIEKFCDEQLAGEKIKRNQYTIGSKKIFSDFLSLEKHKFSNDVKLTIDINLQFILEEELEEGFKRTKSKKAVGIIQNPNNGEILAMASFPSYNPNLPVSDLENLRNTAISDSNEPGSTFKIIVLSAVIEEGLFKLTDKVDCENGRLKIPGRTIRDDHGKAGLITVKQILEISSNVGTAKLAFALGEEKFYKYIRLFGFDSLTGIELTGEAKGSLKPVERWTKGSLPTMSFGQELSATAIQTISAYSAIANGGTLLKPKIIKSIGDKDYSLKEPVRKVVSQETAYKVRQALEGVVKNGTGKSAKVKGFSTGGKTGTAQKYDKELKKYSKKNYMASFCGMIPAMNPEIVVLVIFDEPEGNYYAASLAAPVFAKISQRSAEYLKIKPDENIDAKNSKKEKIKSAKRGVSK